MNRKSTKAPQVAAPSATDSSKNGDGVTRKPTGQEEHIRLLAYQKWEAAGKPPGDGAAFWAQAERELRPV